MNVSYIVEGSVCFCGPYNAEIRNTFTLFKIVFVSVSDFPRGYRFIVWIEIKVEKQAESVPRKAAIVFIVPVP